MIDRRPRQGLPSLDMEPIRDECQRELISWSGAFHLLLICSTGPAWGLGRILFLPVRGRIIFQGRNVLRGLVAGWGRVVVTEFLVPCWVPLRCRVMRCKIAMKTLRINVIHLMLCLRWWLKYLSSFLLSIYVFRLKVKLESFQLIIHDVPCEDGKRLACQSRTPIPSRAPLQAFGWSSRCRWGSCCSSGSWSSKRASKTQSMFHQQDRQIFSSAFHPPVRRKYKRFPDKSDVKCTNLRSKSKVVDKDYVGR